MTVTLSPERVAEIKADYHRKEAIRMAQQQEIDTQHQIDKIKIDVYYQALRKPHRLRKPQICDVCDKTIAAGEIADSYSVPKAAYRMYSTGLHRVYVCESCLAKRASK